MSAYKFMGILLLCLGAFSVQAQLGGEVNDETLLASSEVLEVQGAENPSVLNTNYTPPTAKEREAMENYGWLPLQQVEIQGAISCAWADGFGGEINCPEGAVDCGVLTTFGAAALACLDAAGNVMPTTIGLGRPCPACL